MSRRLTLRDFPVRRDIFNFINIKIKFLVPRASASGSRKRSL